MTLDVLICSFNKGIVKIDGVLLPPSPGIKYIISYQYTDDRYLQMLPSHIVSREDVTFHKFRGQGLSNNRNQAMALATSDLVMYADDDTRLDEAAFCTILHAFEECPDVDVALFRASSYTGRMLKDYPKEEMAITKIPTPYSMSTIEMVFRRERVQGVVRFDERFGLGTKFLTCGEEDIWLVDALRAGLTIRYFPRTTIETSTMLKQSLIYVDAGVQRSLGAYNYYAYGSMSWLRCFNFAVKSAMKGFCHFIPMLRHLWEGILYVRKTN